MKAEEALWNILCGKCIPYKKASKNKLAEVVKENVELKEMLKQAIDDIGQLLENSTCLADCKMCTKDIKLCNGCYEPTWRYAEQALKLIGDENDDVE